MKSEPKIPVSALRAEAARLIQLGVMPSLETVLEAVAESRLKYKDKILQARREHSGRAGKTAEEATCRNKSQL
jgi:hypothetical protein